MTPKQNIDCLFYIISYGAPSITFLLDMGTHLKTASLSFRNFQHLNRLLKTMILMKTYFKDPMFIEDLEWKQNAIPLFETYSEVYTSIINPVISQQSQNFKKIWFHPKLYIENLSHICFLNELFHVKDNLRIEITSQVSSHLTLLLSLNFQALLIVPNFFS